jgi:ribosomal protein L7/L12
MKIAMSLKEARLLINGNRQALIRALRDAAEARGQAETNQRARTEQENKAWEATRKVENLTRDLEATKRTATDWREETERLNKVVSTNNQIIRDNALSLASMQTQRDLANGDLKRAIAEIEALKALQTSKGKATALTEAQAKIKVLEDLLASKGGSEPVLSLTDVSRILAEATSGNKIVAIKLVRELTGWGLREAKDVVEGNYKRVA